MATAREGFNASYRGIGEMLRADWMEAAMLAHVEKAKPRAEATAPVGDHSDGDEPPGTYKASFKTESTRRGGARNDRAEATLLNDSDHAIYVELGTSRQEAQHVIMRAMVEGG